MGGGRGDIARGSQRLHLVAMFLNYLDRSTALLLTNPYNTLLRSAKAMIRREQADQGYSVVDCLSVLSDLSVLIGGQNKHRARCCLQSRPR